MTHRSAMDGSIINTTATPTNATIAFSPAQPTVNVVNPPPPSMPPYPRYFLEPAAVLAAMPRDEDVLMSLQLSLTCQILQLTHVLPAIPSGTETEDR
jgi:hypothetical protein